VQVKGKTTAVKVYEVVPSWSPWAKEDALLEKYTEAYEKKYLQRKFDEALHYFNEILARLPDDKNTQKLKKSAEGFLQTPPPEDWDGVTIHTTK
jgi:adenylate cyclase